jgi:type I restriction enzyme S subunit
MTTRTVTLGRIAKITSGGTPERTKPSYWNGTIPWVKTGQIQNRTITAECVDEWITQEGLEQSSARMVPKGTILMAMYGQGKTRGQVAILGIDATINQACAAIFLEPEAHRDYVYQQLRFRYESIRALSNTGSQENLNAELIREIALPLPELEEQKAIAQALVLWDTAIQKSEQLIAAKERHYSHELSRLISRGRHPHGHVGAFAEELSARNRGGKWQTLPLGDIATVWKGQQLNKDAMVQDGAYYALNGGIKPSGRTTEWNCEADTITVSSGGNSCGFTNFNRERLWCGGDCFALKNLSADADAAYLFHYLKGQQHRMMALRTGSGIPHVYRADLEAFPVILPDLASQNAIARYLNALREEIDLLSQSVAVLKTQKRGLMQKLLTGQWRLRGPDTNDQETHSC